MDWVHRSVEDGWKAVKVLGADGLDQRRVNGDDGGVDAVVAAVGHRAELFELSAVEEVVGLVGVAGLGPEDQVGRVDRNAEGLDVTSE